MLTCLAWSGVAAPAAGQAAGPAPTTEPSADAPADPAAEQENRVRFRGVEGELRTLLQQVSQTWRLALTEPVGGSRLRRRAEDDRPALLQALQSRGYYDAALTLAIDSQATPERVTFRITPGPVYRFAQGRIESQPAAPPALRLPEPAALGLVAGEPAQARTVIDAETALLARIKAQGFALAVLGDRATVIDRQQKTMDVTYRVRPGPRVRFGPVQVTGNREVQARYVQRRMPWQQGDLITPERLDEARTTLFESGLFSTVRIELGQTPRADGLLPVTVVVSERKHRSIEVGVRYRSDEGPGGNIGWEHRNFLGGGELARFALDASPLGLKLTADGREPDFLKRGQALVLGARIADENTDAYSSNSIGGSIGLQRELAKGMSAGLGVGYRVAEVEQNGDTETFGLLSFPADFALDRSDDLLDPTRGGRFTVRNEPFVDTFNQGLYFDKVSLAYRHYLKVSDQPWLVLAGRTALGSIFGAARDDLPADERFYAGGGGSVRGFAFQQAGELDAQDDPIGGRSLLELSVELRTRFTETIGAAMFVDSGAAFEATYPDFAEPLRVGVGGGLRYLSPIGPIRFDVGVPLNKRDSDDPFQIYISLGQAF